MSMQGKQGEQTGNQGEHKASPLQTLFDLSGRVALVTGGSGVLGRVLAQGLAAAGARVAVLGRNAERGAAVVAEITAKGGQAIAVSADVMDRAALERAHEEVRAALGPIDILVCGAGGNDPAATTSETRSFFDLDSAALAQVMQSNWWGMVQSCQVFCRDMVAQGHGSIITIASASAQRPLTRVGAYGAAKAALVNFTQWLAVHMAQEYSPQIRVNAIAPGFFLTEQNRFLLTDAATGNWTPRGAAIVAHTPQARLGDPSDLIGTLVWLASPASAFVTGTVIPVDGGFAAYSGV